MTKLGENYNLYTLVSWEVEAHNEGMNTSSNPTNKQALATLREALGPGFQFAGPSEMLLKTVMKTPIR